MNTFIKYDQKKVLNVSDVQVRMKTINTYLQDVQKSNPFGKQ